jgi:hypothetical protein
MQDPSPHDDVKNGVLLNKDLHGKLDKRELVLVYVRFVVGMSVYRYNRCNRCRASTSTPPM